MREVTKLFKILCWGKSYLNFYTQISTILRSVGAWLPEFKAVSPGAGTTDLDHASSRFDDWYRYWQLW